MNRKTKKEKLYENIFKILMSIFILFIFFTWLKLKQNINFTENQIQNTVNKNNNLQKVEIDLEAEKYIIYNLDTSKFIKGQRENEKSPIASISKIVTVATFLKTLKENNLSIENPKLAYAKSKIQKALVQSDNEDAEILGEIYMQLFGKNLLKDTNTFLQNLNITDFKFISLTGLDIIKKENGKEILVPSNYMSTNDLAIVFKYIYENQREVFEYTKFDAIKTQDNKEIAINTNEHAEKTFGLLISKTGYTDTAKGNLATVVNIAPGQTYLIVVLQSSKEGRFSDIKKIISILPNL